MVHAYLPPSLRNKTEDNPQEIKFKIALNLEALYEVGRTLCYLAFDLERGDLAVRRRRHGRRKKSTLRDVTMAVVYAPLVVVVVLFKAKYRLFSSTQLV